MVLLLGQGTWIILVLVLKKSFLAFDKEIPVYVYCASGGRSEAAAEDLIKNGLKQVYNLAGGIEAWRTQQLPVIQP